MMTKYFRKIRQVLLTENKFSKYLLYATGETFLVVIGILIALQVNNWNEHRKLKNLANQLHIDLHIEFTNNIDYLNTNNEHFTKYIVYLESIISNWSSLDFQQLKSTIPNTYAKENLTLLFYLTNYSHFHDPQHDMFTKALNDGSISSMDRNFVSLLSSLYISFNYRINQFIEQEYKLAQEINKHISETYPGVFLAANKSSGSDWDDETYIALFDLCRKDGVLRYKLQTRLEQMSVREKIIADLLITCQNEIEKFKPKLFVK